MPERKAAPRKSRADTGGEKVIEIPPAELHPFKNHPFKVKDDDSMMETADSIRQYGVLVPAIARPSPEGGYELIAGHRRHRASELAEKETMPVIVRSLDDDAATIIMADSNLQRESLLPSERAFAYKMKLEAIKHQGARHDLTSRQVRAVDKPPYIGNISDYHGKLCIKLPISVAKKKVMVCYAMAFIIRFRFNAVDDKRHCCSAASNPLLYRNFKLCLAFCVANFLWNSVVPLFCSVLSGV